MLVRVGVVTVSVGVLVSLVWGCTGLSVGVFGVSCVAAVGLM